MFRPLWSLGSASRVMLKAEQGLDLCVPREAEGEAVGWVESSGLEAPP